jgi:hypothetical protein
LLVGWRCKQLQQCYTISCLPCLLLAGYLSTSVLAETWRIAETHCCRRCVVGPSVVFEILFHRNILSTRLQPLANSVIGTCVCKLELRVYRQFVGLRLVHPYYRPLCLYPTRHCTFLPVH